MISSAAQPIRRSVLVHATQGDAFEAFTSRMGRWWNPAFSISPTRSAISDVVVEPRSGGRWYERGADGSECRWGTVLIWDPPQRVVLAWQITSAWQFGPEFLTEVEVRFTPEGGSTRVDLEHRLLDRYGDAAPDMRRSFESPEGWGGLLERFRNSVA